jgi:hypothetical protein
MILVTPSAQDQALLKKLTQDVILRKWAARCSEQCVTDFNSTIGKVVGLTAQK